MFSFPHFSVNGFNRRFVVWRLPDSLPCSVVVSSFPAFNADGFSVDPEAVFPIVYSDSSGFDWADPFADFFNFNGFAFPHLFLSLHSFGFSGAGKFASSWAKCPLSEPGVPLSCVVGQNKAAIPHRGDSFLPMR